MTFAKARQTLKALADEIGEDFFSISYEETLHGRNDKRKFNKVDCVVYIHGKGRSRATTFEEALDQLRLRIFPAERPALDKSQAPRGEL